MLKIILTLFIFISALNIPFKAAGDSPWDEYLKKPDRNNFNQLDNYLSQRTNQCKLGVSFENSISLPYKDFYKLLDLVEKGEEDAFRILVMIKKCLDGGPLEDSFRSGGVFFELKPRVFLKIVKDKSIPDSNFDDYLNMLPLASVDDMDLKISIIKNRIEILKSIKDKEFKELIKKGLSFLEKHKEDLIRINKQ